MNIWASAGDKVRYVNPSGAPKALQDQAKRLLIEGQFYTVNRMSVGSSGAFVELAEVPVQYWPYKMFEDALTSV